MPQKLYIYHTFRIAHFLTNSQTISGISLRKTAGLSEFFSHSGSLLPGDTVLLQQALLARLEQTERDAAGEIIYLCNAWTLRGMASNLIGMG